MEILKNFMKNGFGSLSKEGRGGGVPLEGLLKELAAGVIEARESSDILKDLKGILEGFVQQIVQIEDAHRRDIQVVREEQESLKLEMSSLKEEINLVRLEMSQCKVAGGRIKKRVRKSRAKKRLAENNNQAGNDVQIVKYFIPKLPYVHCPAGCGTQLAYSYVRLHLDLHCDMKPLGMKVSLISKPIFPGV